LKVLLLMWLTGEELRSRSRKSCCDLTALDTCRQHQTASGHCCFYRTPSKAVLASLH
jgi:hypothetical protein